MSLTTQEIAVKFAADNAELLRAVRGIETNIDNAMHTIEGRAAAIGKVFTRLGGALVGAMSVQQIMQYADAFTVMDSKLKLVTDSAQQLNMTQQQLFALAQSTRTSYEGTVELYSKVARSAEDLNLQQGQMLSLVKTINQSIALSGGSAASANAAITQLAQGLASGILRGDELNSVIEQTPELARALAAGLGVGRGELKALGEAGALTADRVVESLLAMSDSVSRDFGSLNVTLSQGFTQMNNSSIQFSGQLDRASGASQFFGGVISDVSNILDVASGSLRDLNSNAERGPNSLNELSAASLALGYTFETLGVLTVNTVFVLKTLVDTAYTRASQLSYLVQGEFSKAIQAGNEYNQRAEKGAKLVEGISNALVGSTEKAAEIRRKLMESGGTQSGLESLGNGLDLTAQKLRNLNDFMKPYATQQEKLNVILDEARKKFGSLFTPEMENKIRASFPQANKAVEDRIKLVKRVADSLETENLLLKAQLVADRDLTDAEKVRIKAMQELNGVQDSGISKLLDERDQLQAQIKLREDQKKKLEEVQKVYQKLIETAEQETKSIDDKNLQLQAEMEQIGLTTQALSEYEAQLKQTEAAEKRRLANLYQGADDPSLFFEYLKQAEKLEKQAALIRLKSGKQAAQQLTETNQKMAKQLEDDLISAFEDAFLRGGSFASSFRRALEAEFSKLVLRPVVQSVLSTGQNPDGSGVNPLGLGSQLTSMSGALGGVSSILGASGAFSSFAAASNTFANAAVYGSAQLASLTGASASATASLTGMAASVGAAVPYIAAAYAAYKGLEAVGVISKGETRSGGTYTLQGGQFNRTQGPSGGELAGDQVRAASLETVNLINSTLRSLGSDAYVTGFEAGIETSSKGRGGVFSGGFLSSGAAFGESLGRAGGFESTSPTTLNGEEAVKQFIRDLQQVTLQALQAESGKFQLNVQAYLASLGNVEFLDDTAIQNAITMVQQMDAINDTFKSFAFEGLQELSGATADTMRGFFEAVGGVEQLQGRLAFFYDQFTSEEQKFEDRVKSVSSTFELVGSTLPATRAEFDRYFRALGPDAWAKVRVALPAIDQYYDTIEERSKQAAEQAAQDAQRILSERQNLEQRLLQLQGNTAELRRREVEALDASNRALLFQVYAIEDANKAQQDLAQTLANASQEADRAMAAVDSARSALISSYQSEVSALEQVIARVSTAEDVLRQAYSRESAELQGVISKFGQFSTSIRDFRNQLTVQQLGGAQSLGLLKTQFMDTANRATAGDEDAFGRLQSVAQQYVQSIEQNSSSYLEQVMAIAEVQSLLAQAEGAASSRSTVAQSQLDQLTSLVSANVTLNQSVVSVREAIEELSTARDDAVNASAQISALKSVLQSFGVSVTELGSSLGGSIGQLGSQFGNTVSQLNSALAQYGIALQVQNELQQQQAQQQQASQKESQITAALSAFLSSGLDYAKGDQLDILQGFGLNNAQIAQRLNDTLGGYGYAQSTIDQFDQFSSSGFKFDRNKYAQNVFDYLQSGSDGERAFAQTLKNAAGVIDYWRTSEGISPEQHYIKNKALIDGLGIKTFATGGLVTGPGTGTSDSIPALVSNGEFWMQSAAVRKYGVPFMDSINEGRFTVPMPMATAGAGNTAEIARLQVQLERMAETLSMIQSETRSIAVSNKSMETMARAHDDGDAVRTREQA